MIKRNICLLCGIAFLQGLVFYAPVATLYRQAAGLGIFHITLIESISLALTICLEIPWGWVADRIGYKRTMIFCCGLYFVSKIVFWKAASFGGFLLERVMLSVVCAGLSGVDSSMLYVSCNGVDTHRVFSIYQNLGELGIVLAGGIYALWVGENYRLSAFLTVLAYGAAAILALGLKEVKDPKERETGTRPKEMLRILGGQLRSRKVVFLLLAAILLGETHQTVTVFLSQLQYARAGMSHQMLSLAYIAVSITGLVGGFSSRLCGKTGAKAMGTVLLTVSVGCCVLLGVSAAPVASVLAVLGLRGCYSLMQPLFTQLQNQLVTTSNRATALSMNAVVQDGLGIFLNLVFGYVAEQDLRLAMLFGGVLCVLGLVFYRASRGFSTE